MSGERSFQIANISQLETIDKLMHEAFTPYVKKIRSENTSGPYPWLAGAIENGDTHNCLIGDKIVGYISTEIEGDNLYIKGVGVSTDFQAQGIGSWLMQQIEQYAVKKNLQSLTLQTAEMMSDLLRFYKRHGYIETHRALPDHGDDTHLRVHFIKKL